jgi:hypothetical protein
MKQDIKELWINALESGDYLQTRGALQRLESDGYRPVGYCCLGVLTDIAAKAGVCEWKDDGRIGGVEEYTKDAAISYFNMAELPKAVIEWAGLTSPDPKVTTDIAGTAHATTLGALNDDYKFDFNEIANVIREKL